jgi:hypothetical protein
MASMTGKIGDDMVVVHHGQGTPLFSPDSLMASIPGKISDDKQFGSKKRGCEEVEEFSNSCCGPNLSAREKKGSKQLERPNRCYPLPNSENLNGVPDRPSANLAALWAPIR